MKMKNIATGLALCLTATLTACMDGNWDAPDNTTPSYGNNAIEETNVITIAQLKTQYANEISTSSAYKQVTSDIKIKGVVTGNDISGNIYNEIAVQDATGAIIVCISSSGLFAYLPVGQEVLIDLKGLYVGNYGKQGEIGMPYNSYDDSGNIKGTYVGRMDKTLWQSHVRLIGTALASNVPAPIELTSTLDMEAHCGELVTLKNVTIKEADGKAVFAPDDGSVTLTAHCANRSFNEFSSSKMVLRTSTYADFAKDIMPTGKVNITGIATRYNNTWQLLMRSLSDIKAAN